jgi:hypothetical protein
MAKGVNQCLAQCRCRNIKVFFPFKPLDFSAKRKMLEKERHARIKQFKEIAMSLLVVDKVIFVRSSKASHSNFIIIRKSLRKKKHSGVPQIVAIQQVPFFQYYFN